MYGVMGFSFIVCYWSWNRANIRPENRNSIPLTLIRRRLTHKDRLSSSCGLKFALLLMTYKYVSNPLLGLIFSFNSLKGSPVKRGGEGLHAPPVRQGTSGLTL
ncbi:hypothetical protein F2Q68_00016955 [Brassica cretica]|uniref:Uncharacterized protein n=1 Tax=Brassica cretica TaxID=69181 RepID=A0A8S9HIN1_BRACR|nr:hypothetical protein F2Q68_00016955 [Brassica cretica]